MCWSAGFCVWLLLYGACWTDTGFDWRTANPVKAKVILKVRWGGHCDREEGKPVGAAVQIDGETPRDPSLKGGGAEARNSDPDQQGTSVRLPDTSEE